MSVSMALLGLLADRPSHGYDLKRAYDARFPQARPLAYGQVYATLSRLGRDGLIDVAEVAADVGPERTVYNVTHPGQDALAGWLAEPEPPSPFVVNTLFTKVVIALLVGGSARDFLARQRAAHLARMRELTAAKTSPTASLATVLSADYAIAHLDADLRWIELTADRLDDLTAEVHAGPPAGSREDPP